MKLTGSARKNLRSSGSSTRKPARPTRGRAKHVVCVQSRGYVDLVPLKVYRVLADKSAAAEGMLRVIDESGEDYLFPATYFRPVTAPPGLFDLVAELAR